MTFVISSSAFTDGQPVPKQFTCEGEDISPPLSWTGVPNDAKSLALLVEDPDAPNGTFSHWVMVDIPPQVTELPEGIGARAPLPKGAREGRNDFDKTGYGGPCPPRGHGTHRYVFTLFALSDRPKLGGRVDRRAVRDALEGLVVGEARVMGTYQRK